MKKNFKALFMVAIILVASMMFGCGSDTEYVAVQSQQSVVAEGDIAMNVQEKTQLLTLDLDSEGNIKGLQGLGTMKYKLSNVSDVILISDRQDQWTMPTMTNGKLTVTFKDVVNNDSPMIIFFMDDGEQYQVETRALTFHSTEPMRFFAREWGFEYGHEEETYVEVTRNFLEGTITFNIFFGCDKLVGLTEEVSPDGVGIAWQLEGGSLHPTMLERNEYGSYYASITVPLVQDPMANWWVGPSTLGRLVAYNKSGLRVPFATYATGFDWEYYCNYRELEYMSPYYDVPGMEDYMKFYVSLSS